VSNNDVLLTLFSESKVDTFAPCAQKSIFRQYRNKYNELVCSAKQDFGLEYFSTEQKNKVLWKRVNELGVLKDKANEFNGITSDEFCDHFTSIQSRPNLDRVDQEIFEVSDSFKFKEVYVHDVKRSVFSVESNATGIDKIRLKFIKIIWSSISDSLFHIFNPVLKSVVYPRVWKKSLLCPVPKITRPFSIADFRHICLLPSISKALV